MNTLQKLNSYIGTKYDKDSFHCYTYLEHCLNVPKLSDVHVDTAKDDVLKYVDMFREIDTPEPFCIVLLGVSHIGVWYKGGIFHNDDPTVRYESERVMKLKYNTLKYYEVKE